MARADTRPSTLSAGARLRFRALGDLWAHRSHWQLPLPRALMRRERDTQLSELMPGILVVALMAGILLFVMLPSSLGDSYPAALATLWPIWVVQAAPMAAAQILAMQRAPTLALELTHRHAGGEFAALTHLQASPAAWPCVSLIVAHAWVTAAASVLFVTLTLAFGFGFAFILDVGDLRQSIDMVFALVSPLDWGRSFIAALLLGGLCSLASILSAWPGTQSASASVDAHRLGLRTMMISSVVCVAGALALNWVLNLLHYFYL